MSNIVLYTNHNCPWAHRVHIALVELGLQFEEVQIDLGKPREPWYLEINPRGTVPAMKYGDQIITESAIISQFLADLKESPLLPSSGSFGNALIRARTSFFIDTFASKVTTPLIASATAYEQEEGPIQAARLIEGIEKNIVPLLEGAGPFFGGSKELTLAEVNTAPFVVRIYTYSTKEAGLLPTFVLEKLRANKTWQAWVDALLAKESVVGVYDAESNVRRHKERFGLKN